MIRNISVTALQFVVLLSVQILILNNVNLFGYVEPMIYIWFILILPYKTPKWAVLLLSFLMGFCVDVFSGQVGFHTAVSVFTGFVRPLFLSSFESNQQTSSFDIPTSSNMGFAPYLAYISVLSTIHIGLLISIETFRWSEILQNLLRIGLSSLSTILLIVLCDLIFFKPKKNRF